MKSLTIRDINKIINGEQIGYTDHLIDGPKQLEGDSKTMGCITYTYLRLNE